MTALDPQLRPPVEGVRVDLTDSPGAPVVAGPDGRSPVAATTRPPQRVDPNATAGRPRGTKVRPPTAGSTARGLQTATGTSGSSSGGEVGPTPTAPKAASKAAPTAASKAAPTAAPGALPARIADPALTEAFLASTAAPSLAGTDAFSDAMGEGTSQAATRTERRSRRRRRRVRRALWMMIGVTSTLIVLIGGTLGWVYYRVATRPTIAISSGVLAPLGTELVRTEDLPPALIGLEEVAVTTTVPSTIASSEAGVVSIPDLAPVGTAPGATTPVFATLPTTPLPVEVAPITEDATSSVIIDDEGGATITIPAAQRPSGTLPPPRVNAALSTPPLSGEAWNILISGQDSRADVDAGNGDRFGKAKVSGNRCDTIMVVRIDPTTGRSELLSIPRDIWVTIAGTGRQDRINSACAGGAERLINTVKGNFGIPVHHYVTIDFPGFERIVGAMGGVDLCFNRPARDPITGLNQPAGCNRLNPIQATAFVRSRRYQEQTSDGKWKADPSGDIGRTTRQQRFVGAVMTQALARAKTDPLAANDILGTGLDAVRTDDALGAGDLLDLAVRFQDFDPATMPTFTVTGRPEKRSGKAVLIVDGKARAVVDRFR